MNNWNVQLCASKTLESFSLEPFSLVVPMTASTSHPNTNRTLKKKTLEKEKTLVSKLFCTRFLQNQYADMEKEKERTAHVTERVKVHTNPLPKQYRTSWMHKKLKLHKKSLSSKVTRKQ